MNSFYIKLENSHIQNVRSTPPLIFESHPALRVAKGPAHIIITSITAVFTQGILSTNSQLTFSALIRDKKTIMG